MCRNKPFATSSCLWTSWRRDLIPNGYKRKSFRARPSLVIQSFKPNHALNFRIMWYNQTFLSEVRQESHILRTQRTRGKGFTVSLTKSTSLHLTKLPQALGSMVGPRWLTTKPSAKPWQMHLLPRWLPP